MSIKHITYCYVRLLAEKKWRLVIKKRSWAIFFSNRLQPETRLGFMNFIYISTSCHNSFSSISRRLTFFGILWFCEWLFFGLMPQPTTSECVAESLCARTQDISYDSSHPSLVPPLPLTHTSYRIWKIWVHSHWLHNRPMKLGFRIMDSCSRVMNARIFSYHVLANNRSKKESCNIFAYEYDRL